MRDRCQRAVRAGVVLVAVLTGLAGSAEPARAQAAPGITGAMSFGWSLDTGPLQAEWAAGDGAGGPAGPERLSAQRLAATEVGAEGTGWVRLNLAGTELGGDSAAGTAAVVVVRSLQDGAEQVLDAEALRQWGGTSAYFNGPVVQVELWGVPGTEPSRLMVSGGWAGEPVEWASGDDLCGADDRVASSDNRMARLINGSAVCTTWMFNDVNRFFLTAGHCAPSGTSVLEFNVPPSTSAGVLQHPGPEDQFAVDPDSVQRSTTGPANDWSYFGVLPNTVTGLTPVQQYGRFFTLADTAPAVSGQTLQVSGYGQVSTGDLRNNFAQTSGSGAYTLLSGNLIRYNVDTTGGNSGSAVVDTSTGLVIGIHYYAGCASGGNQGVSVGNPNLRAALASPLGVCRTGRGSLGGQLWLVGDLANNFGTASASPGNFAAANKIGRWWRGLAYRAGTDEFFAIDSTRTLYRVTRAGGVTAVGAITGPTSALSGLAYRAAGNRLFTMQPATGQLWSVDPATAVGTAVGAAQGGNLVGLDGDDRTDRLYAVERASAGASLWRLDPVTGARTRIAGLAGITTQIADIAFNSADGQIYFVDTVTANLTRIDPATGAVSASGGGLGPTNGVYGSNYGLAIAPAATGRACVSDFNADGAVNLDDLADFITDYYTLPAIPGGLQPNAPARNDRVVGFQAVCPAAPDAPAPYAVDAYRTMGYRVGYSSDGSNQCPLGPTAGFPNLDNLGEFITAFYSPCP